MVFAKKASTLSLLVEDPETTVTTEKIKDVVRWIGIALLCETVGALPNPGGVFQQLPGHIHRLEKVYQARNQYEADQTEKKTNRRESDTDGPQM